jgi:hypothetical protein
LRLSRAGLELGAEDNIFASSSLCIDVAAATTISNRECVGITVLTSFDIAAYYLLLHIIHLQFTAQANKVLSDTTGILLS